MGGVLGRNLAKPTNGLGGWAVTHFFRKNNTPLVKNAVRVCDIQADNTVLEVGFGPGIGLEAAYNYVKDGPGVIHGIDISERMLRTATQSLLPQISSGKVNLLLGSVAEMPYKDNTFDRIYHVNCYYFWPDIDVAVKGLHRVMKPDSMMVANLCFDDLKKLSARGVLSEEKFDPERYTVAVKKHGFKHVHMKEYNDEGSGKKYQAIFATAHK